MGPGSGLASIGTRVYTRSVRDARVRLGVGSVVNACAAASFAAALPAIATANTVTLGPPASDLNHTDNLYQAVGSTSETVSQAGLPSSPTVLLSAPADGTITQWEAY